MPEQLSPELNQILKETSRAFYLSLALLPASSRKPLSLAYLLARAADTLADSECLDESRRRPALEKFRELLSTPICEVVTELRLEVFRPTHRGEVRLLKSVPVLLAELEVCAPSEREAITEVVRTLIEGMLWDQELFVGKDRAEGLEEAELERYTYLVAGCVGPFWSYVCASGDPRLAHLLDQTWHLKAIEFGKALQWVNILRDIPKDQSEQRYYLPSLDRPDFREQFLQGYRRALSALEIASEYPLQFPRDRIRDRASTFLLLALGWRTLEQLLTDGGPRPGRRSKVSRWEVLCWLALSPVIVSTDWGFRILMDGLRQRAETAVGHWES